MSRNIIIRDLSKDQQLKLDALKDYFNEKTNSKVIEKLIENFEPLRKSIQKLKQENYNLKDENNKLLSFFRRIESEVDEINESNEDSNMY